MRWKLIWNRFVVWSIKNHWILLVTVVGMQYLTGKMMTEWGIPFGLSVSTVLEFHEFNGGMIMLLAVGLSLEKGYLWLKRKGKV